MKHNLKKISSLILALVLILSMTVTAFAADSVITFKGALDGFEMQPGSQYTATDLFDGFKGVMPGDKLTESIQVKNTASDCDYIKVYLRADIHDENGNPLSPSVAAKETVASMHDFLSQLTMRIYNDGELIYDASPDEAGALANNVYLGTLAKGQSLMLYVELDVPITLGNEYANRVGEVDWVFLAECIEYEKLTVHKVWDDNGYPLRTNSVKVHLLRDGERFAEVDLSKENHWTHTWDQLDDRYTWTVEEDVPLGYEAIYTSEDNNIFITNYKDYDPYVPPQEPETPEDPETPENPEEPSNPDEPGIILPDDPEIIVPDDPIPGGGIELDPIDLTVKKVWSDENDKRNIRPDFVTVTLYRNDKAYEKVRLGEWNDWTYEWEDLDGKYDWGILETGIPKGYTPSYSAKGDVVTITNTATLIQTGQLNWPILVLGGLGVLMIFFGVIMMRKKKADGNA